MTPSLRTEINKVVFIGQAPPKEATDIPFGRTRLYEWLSRVGISKERALSTFAFTALIDEYPGKSRHGHKKPEPLQIIKNRPQLLAFLKKARPTVIVPVGILAIREVLQMETASLQKVIGHRFVADPFGGLGLQLPIIPLPHPSGASAWIHLAQNDQLLKRALTLLRDELAKVPS